jgi:protein-tyrosine phosphatase
MLLTDLMRGEDEMYDIHCHILPGVDDGPSNIEMALGMAYAAEQVGIKVIVCTPHYTDDKFKNSSENNLLILDSFKKAIERSGIGIEIYLGNEVHITPDIVKLLDSKNIITLNNSRYILIEMPSHSKPLYTDDMIFKLKLRGLIPIIAHPERYEWVIRNPKELSNIISKGCLTQLNIASINGYYGESVRKAAKTLVRENHIHLLGSDSHSSKIIYSKYHTDLKLLQKISSEHIVKQMILNTGAVINNQVVKTFS